MPKRRPRAVLPPPTTQVVPPTRERAMVSVEEKRTRLAYVEGMVLNCWTESQIVKGMHDQFHVGRSAALRLVDEVKDAWRQEPGDKEFAKKYQLKRLYDHLRALRAAKEHEWDNNAIARVEGLVADLEGTREPAKVDVNVSFRGALAAVVSTLSDDQIERAERIALERARLADAARRRGIGPDDLGPIPEGAKGA